MIERISSYQCTPKNGDTSKEDRVKQQESLMGRNQQEYELSLKNAGFRIVSKFSRETVLALKTKLPMNMWWLLKRTFKLEIGQDVFGSEKLLRQELQELEFEYECGSFTSEAGKQVNFVRVTDLKQVICMTLNQLSHRLTLFSNIPGDTLWLMIGADKGGHSTKLVLQVLNVVGHHSKKAGKVLALFEGDKDNYENCERVFKPVIEGLVSTVERIEELKIKCRSN